MKKKIEKAIELLAEKIEVSVRVDEAMRLTQAMLNLAHTLSTLRDVG